MPVFLNPTYPGPERRAGLSWPRVPPSPPDRPSDWFLHVGLVNNMGDAAMSGTEHQFLALLEAAAPDLRVHVTLYALPGVERRPFGQRRVASFYASIEQLWRPPPASAPERYPDGLIVTGREPSTADLRDEAYWPSLQRLLAWTQEHRRSAVWSCLAAHAAVLALDGIERVRSPHKHFGIFTCKRAAPHALLSGAPARLRLPHSRWNGVPAGPLAAHGYEVLTHTADGGVDTFIKHDASLLVFFQGHPEYAAGTLMGEYRRDVGRYLRGESETYPSLPRDYFDAEAEQALRAVEAKARASRRMDLLGEVSTLLHGVRVHHTWRDTAVLMYRNWLEHLCAQRVHGTRPLCGVGGMSHGV